jgi:hypothetical protein
MHRDIAVVRLPVPIADSATLLNLLQLELHARSPGAAACKIRIELNPVEPRVQQHGLFIAGRGFMRSRRMVAQLHINRKRGHHRAALDALQ